MEIAIIIFAGLLILLGIVGSLLPVLPGPPLSYSALLVLHFGTHYVFETNFLIVWGVITAGVTLMDYVIPMYGTKRMGGSRSGMIGCSIGLVVGMFFSPIGIVVGPFLGAFIGEILANQDSQQAFRAAVGSFLGFLLGTLLKLITCIMMAWYYIEILVS